MRVKLSYSVNEEDLLGEAAKMLNLSSDRLQEVIQLFQAVQQELVKDDDAEPNLQTVLDKLDELRRCLFEVDTRASEVGSVVMAYDDYRREQRLVPPTATEEDGQDNSLGAE